MAVIYRQEILQDIAFFTSAPKANFYDKLFIYLDLSDFPDYTAKTGQKRLWCHSFNSAQNLNTIAHIALLAVAHAAILTKSHYSYRSLKSVKRIA